VIVSYFAPRLRAGLAYHEARLHGIEAWREFVDRLTFHRRSDQLVTRVRRGRYPAYPVALALAMAREAVNAFSPRRRP